MILRYTLLNTHPHLFQSLTGLTVREFDALYRAMEGYYVQAETEQLERPGRQRAIGGGRRFTLSSRDQLRVTVVGLRMYPTQAVLGYLVGMSATINILPLPLRMFMPMNTVFVRSLRLAPLATGAGVFSTGNVSPVSAN